ncbi:MAG: ATP-binding cassette domain-containing protein [Candidatus Methanoliparum thermophilum]|uniref:ATP-binding cassette domain-containing protein n=1 Tax=Methanoliparum thermophilum TaxID=2491083 RepID=A0A520KRI1_METT2|nr:ATP-binding cassette domain-containing protein [Candidatus Methanoliparum sp. LAM-1]RZN64295.1 MAG: ATP-binding cassette domain-containing protein [Candidatus Methanoliparum thermophilum]BDC35553.1 ABC transporter ATP-binding protein [Candidatus Methanoliparum sp. LAM-1]
MSKKKILSVKDLNLIHGKKPCGRCLELTGPEVESNICPVCGSIVACADISFDLNEGEILGIVGESGSGKSTIVQCLYFDVRPTGGEAYISCFEEGKVNIFSESSQKKRYMRSNLMGIVYQNPQRGLNFDFSCGGNIAEKLLMAGIYNIKKIRDRSTELLTKTEISTERIDDPPGNFSGGMQQRVQISKALANNPAILFLDEVTTGLDVSVQARVLDLIRQLQRQLGISMIIVSHDLRVIRLLAHRTIVMKNGRIVEMGLTDQILEDPQHKYSQLLVNSML